MTVDPKDGSNYASFIAVLVAPLSRGNISINSTDMSDPPLVNPGWLTDAGDVEVAIAAFKRTREIWAAMNNITIGPEYWPGNNVSTDAEILEVIRTSVRTIYHVSKNHSSITRSNSSNPNTQVLGIMHKRDGKEE